MWTVIGIIALGASIVYAIAVILGYGFQRGYDAAVCDIMRYGFYMKDGERHEVENIRIWSD